MNEKTVAVKQGSTPAEMIQQAVAGGADLEQLEKLLELQERWEANEARKAYHKAMAEFKANPPEIDKDKTVSYGNTRYNHASLANVVKKITTELSKHGLSASWATRQNGAITVTCRITHVLGHTEETTLTAPADSSGAKNSIQAIGSTISYLERYTLLAALGLATHDQDNDGHGTCECITDQQVNELRDLLIKAGMEKKEDKLLKYLEVPTLEEIPGVKYQQAVSVLEAKINKGEKA